MKTFKKIAAALGAAIIMLCCCACSVESKYKKLRAVKPEVSYGYTAVGRDSVSKDCYVYTYEGLAQDIIKKPCALYPYYNTFVNDNQCYFLYEYDSHGNASSGINNCRFDVGLFCVNVETVTCELVYKFTNVYPTSAYTFVNQDLGKIYDENRMLVQYNGQLQILNLQTRQITYTADVYNKEQYLQSDYLPFQFNDYGDYEVLRGNRLCYYELSGYEYILHEYAAHSDSIYVDRYGNYVYTSGYSDSKRVYYDCYDITTDKEVNIEELTKALSESKKPTDDKPEQEFYTIDGVNYKIEISGGRFEISDEDGNVLKRIGEDYMMMNSKPFRELYNAYSKQIDYYSCGGFTVVDNKLFISFMSEYGWIDYTPLFIYEYDIVADKVYYVGFSQSGLSDLRLH